MRCRLKTYELSPPGRYPFEDTNGHPFPAVPMIEDTAKAVSAYRSKNGMPRASVRECLEDVDAYTCQRLGNMAQWCLCNDQAVGQTSFGPGNPILNPPCHGCGATV